MYHLSSSSRWYTWVFNRKGVPNFDGLTHTRTSSHFFDALLTPPSFAFALTMATQDHLVHTT